MIISTRKILLSTATIFSSVILFWGAPIVAEAETHLDDETVFPPTVSWTAEGSPYILDSDVFIPSSTDVYIGPGVTVSSASDAAHSLYLNDG